MTENEDRLAEYFEGDLIPCGKCDCTWECCYCLGKCKLGLMKPESD